MKGPSGAYAPVPTPVDDSGSFDPEALERHLGWLAEQGLDGALVLGTNGEFPSFDFEERLTVAETAARCGVGLELMLGVGSCALPEVLRLTNAAAQLGFGSVLMPPPFYFRAAPEVGLSSFFRAVLDRADVAVLVYNIPQVTGVPITDPMLRDLVEHPSFGGVKDSSGDKNELERFLAALDGQSYMVGHDRLVTLTKRSGGSGSITAAANVVPSLVAATHRDPSHQNKLDAVRELLEEYGLGPAVKAVLRWMDIGAFRTRPPLVGLDDIAASELIRRFETLISSEG